MEDFIKKGLDKIKKEQITPIAKWRIETRNFFWWTAFALSVLAGGISISILVFLVSQLDWQIYTHLGDGFLETFLIMFPHFWLLFLGVFLFISYRNLRHTKKGYHYELLSALVTIVFASFILSTLFYFSGLNQKLNQIFTKNIPGYEKVIHTKEDQWSQPQKGLISGKIILQEQKDDSVILTIETFKQEKWEVSVTKKTLVRGRAKLENKEVIKVIGVQTEGKNNFIAIEIRPWEGRGNNRIK